MIDRIAGLHGTEKYLYNFLNVLDKGRFSPIIVSLYSEERIAPEFFTLGVRVYSVPIKKLYEPVSFKQYHVLYRLIKNERVDLIETIHRTSDLVGPIIGRLAGTKVIVSNRRDMGFLRTSKDDVAYRVVDRLVDRIKCNTCAAALRFSKIEGCPLSKFDISYNGIDQDLYRISDADRVQTRKKYGILPKEIVIGVIGGVKKVKGHREFIEMAEALSRTYPHLRFLVVGGGYKKTGDDYFKEIQELSSHKGLNGAVLFTGHLPNPIPELSIFDIAVLPSYTEGCSNALLEYMASEKPVVATDVGGNPELVTDEVTGFIVPRGDVPSLVQKVSYLIDSKDLRSKMGTAGGKKVKRFFSMSKIIDAQMNYYENLICWKERNESPHQHR